MRSVGAQRRESTCAQHIREANRITQVTTFAGVYDTPGQRAAENGGGDNGPVFGGA
jgi:hypothetical protein